VAALEVAAYDPADMGHGTYTNLFSGYACGSLGASGAARLMCVGL